MEIEMLGLSKALEPQLASETNCLLQKLFTELLQQEYLQGSRLNKW